LVKHKLPTSDMMTLVLSALDNHQSAHFKVRGFSMNPFLKHDQTTVKIVPIDTLKKYDIILFKYRNTFRLHRIIHIKNEQITLQGDNTYKKEVIDSSMVLGRIISYKTNKKMVIIRSFKHYLKFFVWQLIKPIILSLRSIYGKLKKNCL